MKRFLKLLLLFSLPLVLIGSSLEYLLRSIPNRFKEQLNYIETHEDQIETLILGSSHSLYGINPIYLESHAFNLSNISQTLDLDAKLLYEFGEDMENLEQVVIRLSYTTLYEKLEVGEEGWRLKDYEQSLKVDVSEKLKYNFEILSVSLKENMKRVSGYFNAKSVDINYNLKGWSDALANRKPANLETSGKITAIKHTAVNNTLLEENVKILKGMIQWCNMRNVDLILVTLPAYSSYYTNLNDDQLNTTITIGKELEKEFSNCKYYNFLKDSRFTETDFYDGDHLNEKGSKNFSILLNSLLTH